MLIPDAGSVALKKSKMLLLVIRFPVLGVASGAKATIGLVGRLVPAGPRLQNETVLLLLFPDPAVVPPNTIFPAIDKAAGFAEPKTAHRVTVLFCAPLINRIVPVPRRFETVVFENVSELPPVPSPSMVTLSAP